MEKANAAVVLVALFLVLEPLRERERERERLWMGESLTVRHPIRLCSKGRWKARGSPHQSSSSVAAVWKFAGFCKCWKGNKEKDCEICGGQSAKCKNLSFIQ